MTSVSSLTAGMYVPPMISAMSYTPPADVSYNAIALEQQRVTISNIDYDFTADPHVFPSEAAAAAFLNLFTVSHNENAADGSELSVAFADAGSVANNAILAAINNSKLADKTLKQTLEALYDNVLTLHILKSIGVSLPPNAFSNAVSLDASGGASAAVSGLISQVATSVYLQIPQNQLESADYMDAATNLPKTSALPLVKGDKMVFVFDLPQPSASGGITVTFQTQNPSNAVVDGDKGNGIVVTDVQPKPTAGQTADGLYTWTGDVTEAADRPAAKRVAFAVQMTSGSGSFSIGAGGLKE